MKSLIKKSYFSIKKFIKDIFGSIILFFLKAIASLHSYFLAIIKKNKNFRLLKLLEPKRILVKDIFLYAIESSSKITVKKIEWSTSKSNCSIKEAIEEANTKIDEYRSENFLPIICIEELDVFLGGVKIFLTNLSKSLHSDLGAFNLNEPFNFRLVESGIVFNIILDFDDDRILILGKSEAIISNFKLILEKFSFSNNTKSYLSHRISHILKTYSSSPFSGSMVIGAFGAIYAFVAGILINKLVNLNLTIAMTTSVFASLGSYIWWLTLEGFEKSIVAISPRWTAKLEILSWLTFLSILLYGPVVFLSTAKIINYIPFIKLIATLNISIMIIKNMGEVFYENGLSKKITILLWFAFLFIIHLSDLVFSLIPINL